MPTEKQAGTPRVETGLILVSLADVAPESVRWLWPRYIPLGKLTIIEGDPGTGKSLVSLDLAARISTGREMPDGSPCELGGVVLLNAEDGLADTVVPRLEGAGADRSRIKAITGARDLSGERLPDLARDITRIEEAIRQEGAKLVVVDPLNAYLPDTVNSWSDHQIRRVLAPLAKMAERTGVAVLVIRHLNKAVGGNAIYRGGGSIGIIAAARAAFLIAPEPNNESTQIFAPVKFNLGRHPPSLAFRLQESANGSVGVVWQGEVEYTAAQLHAQWQPQKTSALDRAVVFLEDFLLNGPVSAEEVKARAQDAEITERTLERAKKAVGVKVHKEGFGSEGQWLWSLESDEGCQSDLAALVDSSQPASPEGSQNTDTK